MFVMDRYDRERDTQGCTHLSFFAKHLDSVSYLPRFRGGENVSNEKLAGVESSFCPHDFGVMAIFFSWHLLCLSLTTSSKKCE